MTPHDPFYLPRHSRQLRERTSDRVAVRTSTASMTGLSKPILPLNTSVVGSMPSHPVGSLLHSQTPIYTQVWVQHTLRNSMDTLVRGVGHTAERMQRHLRRAFETRQERVVREAGEEAVALVRHGLRHITAALDEWDPR